MMNSTDDLAVRGPRALVFRHEDASLYRGTVSGFLEVSCGHQRSQRRKSEVLICLLSPVLFELLISLPDNWKGTLSLQDGQRGFNMSPGNSHEAMNVVTVNPNAV